MDLNKEIQDELNELSPALAKLDKQEGFEVPPRYFEKLSDEVLQKIKTNPVLETKQQIPNWQQSVLNVWAAIWQPRVAIGLAAIAMFVVATTFFFNNQSKSTGLADIGSISDEELSLFIQENFDEFDAALLANVNDLPEGAIIPSNIDDEILNEYYEQVIDEIDVNDLEDLL